MVFQRHVEVGRLCLLNKGPNAGKLVTIVEIVDMKRLLVDGPTTGVNRQMVSLKDISMTDFTSPVNHDSKQKYVIKALNKSGAVAKFQQTKWAAKIAQRATRKNLSDFDRFKVMLARKKKSFAVRKEFNKLKSKSK
eukprot:GFYU01000438.1.p2 GENE.GFYU01000438.1~~GFYU01000438.1.p2  ORF type:complete len:136 (-),score=41.81 GFYU01000438.1:126-533(-)